MQNTKRFLTSTWSAALCALVLAGCSAEIEHRGYIPKPGAFNQIATGMSKMEVEGILGTPSTTASVQFKGDSYYYITSTTRSKAFMKEETGREVIAIRFDDGGKVKSFAQYGLEDGRIIDINTRKTVVIGEDTSILATLFRTATGTTPGPMLGRKM